MNKKETLVRINSRCRKDQLAYIKAKSKKEKKGEGAVHREILDYYIAKNK